MAGSKNKARSLSEQGEPTRRVVLAAGNPDSDHLVRDRFFKDPAMAETEQDEVYDRVVREQDIYEPIGTYSKKTGEKEARPKNKRVNIDMATPTSSYLAAKKLDERQADKVDRKKDKRNRRRQFKIRTWRRT